MSWISQVGGVPSYQPTPYQDYVYNQQKLFKAFGLDEKGLRPDGSKFAHSCCSTPKHKPNLLVLGDAAPLNSEVVSSDVATAPIQSGVNSASSFFDREMAAAAARNTTENSTESLNATKESAPTAPAVPAVPVAQVESENKAPSFPPNFPFPETISKNKTAAKNVDKQTAASLPKENIKPPVQKQCVDQVGLTLLPGQKYYHTAAFREHIASVVQSQKKVLAWSKTQINSHLQAYNLAQKTLEEAQLALERLKLKTPRSIATQELIEQNIIRKRIAASESMFHAEMLKVWRAYGEQTQQLIDRLITG